MAENGTGRPLTPKQTAAIAALLTSPSNEAAAKKAGVGLRTLNRWLTDPNFRLALRQAQDEALAQTFLALATAGAKAARVLSDIASDKEAAPAARVSAARATLDQLLRYAEVNDLAGRLAALEAEIYGK